MSGRAPFVEGSKTSASAADRKNAGSLYADRARIMAYFDSLLHPEHGATDDEIQVALRLSGDTQRPRRIDLIRGGFLRDSGRTRKTRKGRDATVWVVTE